MVTLGSETKHPNDHCLAPKGLSRNKILINTKTGMIEKCHACSLGKGLQCSFKCCAFSKTKHKFAERRVI